MADRVLLTGLGVSIYTWSVRFCLAEKGVGFDFEEVDPFAGSADARLSPFGRVPVLRHGTFELYETAAILRYVDRAFDGPRLEPREPRAAARMAQVMAIADAHAYWPLVRQVYAQRVFAPREGGVPDEGVIAEGLAAARRVLGALEVIAAEGLWPRAAPNLADMHLAPMLAAFAEAPEGAEMLGACPALTDWLARVSARPSFVATRHLALGWRGL